MILNLRNNKGFFPQLFEMKQKNWALKFRYFRDSTCTQVAHLHLNLGIKR